MRNRTVVAAALFMAACGGSETVEVASGYDAFCENVRPSVEAFLAEGRATHPVPDDPRYGGSAVVAYTTDLRGGLSPIAGGDYGAVQHQQFVVFSTLIDYDADLQPVAKLAESWEVSADGTQLTFRLRDDVYWHDGEITDAHDLAFTYGLVTNEASGYPNASFFDHYVPAAEGGIEVVDDFTVRIHLRPHAEYMDAWRTVALLPEHLLGEVPVGEIGRHPFSQCPVGNGPFVLASYTPQDRWIFEANPSYSAGLGGRPFLDRLTYRVIPEATTLLSEHRLGNVDFMLSPTPRQAAIIEEDDDVALNNFGGRQYTFIGWNARRPQLSDARVRRALTMGTDRAAIVQAAREEYAVVANSGVPPVHWAYSDDATAEIAYDPAGAAQLLSDAGWVDRDGDGVRENEAGLPLSITILHQTGNAGRQLVAEATASQLTGLGVAATTTALDFGAIIDIITDAETRDFDGVVMAWNVEYRLDETDLFHSSRIDGLWAFAGTNNAEVDRLLEALSETVERADATPLWTEYRRVITQEQPYTYFYFPIRINGIHKRLKGAEMDSRGEWLNVHDWYIDPALR